MNNSSLARSPMRVRALVGLFRIGFSASTSVSVPMASRLALPLFSRTESGASITTPGLAKRDPALSQLAAAAVSGLAPEFGRAVRAGRDVHAVKEDRVQVWVEFQVG